MIMVNISAAVNIALARLIGAMVRTLLFQTIWKVVQSKAFLDSIEQLVQHSVGYPVSLPHRDISLDIFHPRTGQSCLAYLS